MGWKQYNLFKSKNISNFVDMLEEGDYYFLSNKTLCIIKQKQELAYNKYEFMVCDSKTNEIKSKPLGSNIDLLDSIRENLACDLEYQRFFQINSILNNNK
jgi:hypothetical protein